MLKLLLYKRNNLLQVLAASTARFLQFQRYAATLCQFLIFRVFKSFSTSSIHLVGGLPLVRDPNRILKCRPTNHSLINTSRLYRISASSAAPPVLTSKNEKRFISPSSKGSQSREENLRIEEQKEKLRIEEQKEKLRIEEQKEKLRIEEQKEKLRIEEREEKLRFEQLRLDEQKRKDEFELEKLRIQTQSKLGADTSKESDTKFLVKEISKFIHRFDLKEDISLYLKLFERQAQRLNIDQENWVSHLLGLLPTEVSHIIAREPDDKANSYEHVKDLLLKRFKLTPEKFRQLFFTHQKTPERTWIDFYHELNTYFNGWIDGLKIDTFKKLSDLIMTDQLKRKTPFEFKEYYLDEWANMNSLFN
ncbi:homeotic protein female sterile [Trichonephila clavipes]|nr:homeotic protein female sterile [Trichonephila clavipes]